MVKQYPHTMTVTIVPDSIQDSEGNWTSGQPFTKVYQCRAEPNGSGRMIMTADQRQIVYSWTIYMPKGTPPVPDGSLIEVNSSPAAKGKTLSFSQGQLNSRLWV